HAAHFNLPEMPFQLPAGSDLMNTGDFWKSAASVFTGEPIGQARRLDVDVLLLHAQRADRAGNIEIEGARGLDLSLLGAARQTLVTVEEIVDVGQLGDRKLSFVLPRHLVTAVAEAPGGAYPTSCLPYYSTDYEALLEYVRSKSAAFDFTPARRDFLGRAAQVRGADMKPEIVQKHRAEIPEDAPYTIEELMAVALAREYDNSSVCSVG